MVLKFIRKENRKNRIEQKKITKEKGKTHGKCFRNKKSNYIITVL